MGDEQYPLVLMLEPLFQCNLACAGCGKIDYPDEILRKRISVSDDPGGGGRMRRTHRFYSGGRTAHPRRTARNRRRYRAREKSSSTYARMRCCWNARSTCTTRLPYLTFSIHLDGDRARHDESVCRTGVFDKALLPRFKLALDRGFRVNVNCTLYSNERCYGSGRFLSIS